MTQHRTIFKEHELRTMIFAAIASFIALPFILAYPHLNTQISWICCTVCALIFAVDMWRNEYKHCIFSNIDFAIMLLLYICLVLVGDIGIKAILAFFAAVPSVLRYAWKFFKKVTKFDLYDVGIDLIAKHNIKNGTAVWYTKDTDVFWGTIKQTGFFKFQIVRENEIREFNILNFKNVKAF